MKSHTPSSPSAEYWSDDPMEQFNCERFPLPDKNPPEIWHIYFSAAMWRSEAVRVSIEFKSMGGIR